MTIEHMSEKSMVEIQDEIKQAVERMANQATHSVIGTPPDTEGRYPEQRINSKERREILNIILADNEYLNLTEEGLGLRFASNEDFLQALVSQIQNYQIEVCIPICKFIEKEFGLKIDYIDRDEIRFRNKVHTMKQMLTLSEKKIREALGYGELDPEEEERIIHKELIPRFQRKEFR